VSTEIQDDRCSINKEKYGSSSDKLDPIIAVLEEYVRAVEKYEKTGNQSVLQHHRDNIALLKNWGGTSLH
jgi:hypothetical protein